MAPHYPTPDLKAAVVTLLRQHAKAGTTLTYGGLGQAVGRPARGPWKKLLDQIGAEEKEAGRPDLACLVVNSGTGFPSYVGEVEADRRAALTERARVFAAHRGTREGA